MLLVIHGVCAPPVPQLGFAEPARLFHYAFGLLGKLLASISRFTNDQFDRTTDDIALSVEVDIMQADLTKLKNDWIKDKVGGSYKSNISGQPGEDAFADGSVFDTDRRELEDLFGTLIEDAKTGSAGPGDQSRAARN